MPGGQPISEAVRLARRLRELREREFIKLTQAELGKAFADGKDPVSPAAISTWENPASGRLPPAVRLEAYARLFCTPRSFDGGAHLLGITDLTADELRRMKDLKQELLDLRDRAALRDQATDSGRAESMWHFPDGSSITLVCSRLPAELQPPQADRSHINYVRFADLADLDALIEIYGEIKAYNPTSRVYIRPAQDLTPRHVTNHLVLIGGKTWNAVTQPLSRIFPIPIEIFPIPIESRDTDEHGAIVVHNPDGEKKEFVYTLADNEVVEDVGFFARGENPSAPRLTLTICSGITTRGALGAAQCFIDREMKERNEQYLIPRFLGASAYCIVMRVPVVNGYPLTPDLSKDENRLFEWSAADTDAE
jgi:Helix-turn-helix domain